MLSCIRLVSFLTLVLRKSDSWIDDFEKLLGVWNALSLKLPLSGFSKTRAGVRTVKQKESFAGLRSDTNFTEDIQNTSKSLEWTSMRCFRENQNGTITYVYSRFIIHLLAFPTDNFPMWSGQWRTTSGHWHHTILNASCFCMQIGVCGKFQTSKKLLGEIFCDIKSLCDI